MKTKLFLMIIILGIVIVGCDEKTTKRGEVIVSMNSYVFQDTLVRLELSEYYYGDGSASSFLKVEDKGQTFTFTSFERVEYDLHGRFTLDTYEGDFICLEKDKVSLNDERINYSDSGQAEFIKKIQDFSLRNYLWYTSYLRIKLAMNLKMFECSLDRIIDSNFVSQIELIHTGDYASSKGYKIIPDVKDKFMKRFYPSHIVFKIQPQKSLHVYSQRLLDGTRWPKAEFMITSNSFTFRDTSSKREVFFSVSKYDLSELSKDVGRFANKFLNKDEAVLTRVGCEIRKIDSTKNAKKVEEANAVRKRILDVVNSN